MSKPAKQTGRCLSVAMVVSEYFPGRSDRWVKDKAKAGEFGEVFRDNGGWLIPEAGLQAYLSRHRVTTQAQGSGQHNNLVQFAMR